MKIGITPRSAAIVDTHRFVDLDVAIQDFGGGESNFPEGDAEVFVQFTRDVNFFGIRQVVRPPSRRVGGTARAVAALAISATGLCRFLNFPSVGIIRIRFKGSPEALTRSGLSAMNRLPQVFGLSKRFPATASLFCIRVSNFKACAL